ncbi:proton-coupled folate transporter-like [Amphiura filiformis]|uniref:proton-coupled folate transporter-like n=1 Tax=Amphiura filiformis TaxID=82378 RepID=UPI003B2137DB
MIDHKNNLKMDETKTQPENVTLRVSRRTVTVEPVVFFVMCWLGNVLSISSQYLQRRIATDKYNYTLPNTSNATCDINSSSPDFYIQKEIQSEASQWMLYLNACATFPPLISTIIIGAWSDIHGRKIAIGLPVLGCTLNCLSFIAVILFHLRLEILILGGFLQGALGGYPLLLTGCLAYISDITTEKQRTFRISMIEITLMVAIAGTQIGTGYLIEDAGFLTTFYVLLGFLLSGIIYVSVPCILLETRLSSKMSVAHQLKGIWQDMKLLFKTNTNRRRGDGGSTIGAKILPMFLSDSWILHICFISLVASMITIGLAKTDAIIYLSAIIGCLRVLSPPVVRSLMSKTVTDQEQGVMFSFLSSAVGAAEFVAPLILNSIYSATVFFDPSLVFYISAGMAVLPIILTCMFQVIAHNRYEHLVVGMDDGHVN